MRSFGLFGILLLAILTACEKPEAPDLTDNLSIEAPTGNGSDHDPLNGQAPKPDPDPNQNSNSQSNVSANALDSDEGNVDLDLNVDLGPKKIKIQDAKISFGGSPFTDTTFVGQLSVAEEEQMVYVLWEGLEHYMVSVAKDGKWIVRDRQVYPESYGVVSGKHVYLGGFGEKVRFLSVGTDGNGSPLQEVHSGQYMRLLPIRSSAGEGALIVLSETKSILHIPGAAVKTIPINDTFGLLYEATSIEPNDGYGPGSFYADLESGQLYYSSRIGHFRWSEIRGIDLEEGAPLHDNNGRSVLIAEHGSFIMNGQTHFLAVGSMRLSRMERTAGGILDDFTLRLYNQDYVSASNEVQLRVVNMDAVHPGKQAMTQIDGQISFWNAQRQHSAYSLDLIRVMIE
jgi:hypothetical protein